MLPRCCPEQFRIEGKEIKMRINFTKTIIDNLRPNSKRYKIYDETVPKLALIVTEKGTKSFAVIKRTATEEFLNEKIFSIW